MILPSTLHSATPGELLRAAAQGRIGLDQRLIRALIESPKDTLAALDEFAYAEDSERIADLTETCFDLYRALGTPAATRYFIHLLRGNPSDIPDELVEAFAALGPAALDDVLACHAAMAPEDAADIVFLIAAMGVSDERVRAIMRDTLARDPYEGGLSIGLLADPALKPDVEAALAALPPGAQSDRKALEDCLATIEAAPAARDLPPFDIFELYPATAAPPLEVLPPEEVLPYLSCDSAEYRAAAARSFADEDYGDEVRDGLLARALNDESPEVRAEAFRALGACASDPSIRPHLTAAATNQSAPVEVRAGALIALAPQASEAELQPVLLTFYEHEATRPAALEAMRASLDVRYQKYFAANLRHEDEDIQLQAIQGVGAIPLPQLALELVPLFDHPSFREEALVSYALSVDAPITPKSVSKLFDRIEEKAGGMTEEESEAVAFALDFRLESLGFRPVFFPDEEEDVPEKPPVHHDAPVRAERTGRNDPCPCGSGKKFKKCCGA